MTDVLNKVAASYVKPKFTDVKVGDTVRVYIKIREGEKERLHYFEGLVIRRRGGLGSTANFTVRRIASGVGVERTFPVHSPLIDRVVVQRAAKTRRATLYTMRGRTGKAARLTEIPFDRAAREIEHPWIEQFGITSEIEQHEATEAEVKQADAETKVADEAAPANAEEAIEAGEPVAEAPVEEAKAEEGPKAEAKDDAPAAEKKSDDK